MTDIKVYKNASPVGKAGGIDFKEGTGISLTVARDDANNQTDVTIANSSPKSDNQLLNDAEGFVVQTYNRQYSSTDSAMASGDLRLMLTPVRAGQVLTTGYVVVTAQATSVTAGYIALYDTSYNRLAVTANTTTLFSGAGLNSAAFTTPYTVSADGALYIAALVVAGGNPTIMRMAGSSGNIALGTVYPYAKQAGQSSPPATATPAVGGGVVWVGIV